MSVNWKKIVGRAAVYAAATPENPVKVKAQIIQDLAILNPDLYASVQQQIRAGAYIVEA